MRLRVRAVLCHTYFILNYCFSGARSHFLPGSSPAQEEDQGPQSGFGEGQEEPGKGGETAREAAQERAGAAEGGAVGSAPQRGFLLSSDRVPPDCSTAPRSIRRDGKSGGGPANQPWGTPAQ